MSAQFLNCLITQPGMKLSEPKLKLKDLTYRLSYILE